MLPSMLDKLQRSHVLGDRLSFSLMPATQTKRLPEEGTQKEVRVYKTTARHIHTYLVSITRTHKMRNIRNTVKNKGYCFQEYTGFRELLQPRIPAQAYYNSLRKRIYFKSTDVFRRSEPWRNQEVRV